MKFGPKNEREAETFAVEAFRVGVQHAIQSLLNERGVTQRELAQRLGVSAPRISQIFSEECNLTIRFMARVAFALESEWSVDFRKSEWSCTHPHVRDAWHARVSPPRKSAAVYQIHEMSHLAVGEEYGGAQIGFDQEAVGAA